MYAKFFKRVIDFMGALVLLLLLLPIYIIVYILVVIFLGYPAIFRQKRPGKDEKIFEVMKFRSMSNAKDEDGNLLPDEQRLSKFGIFLRKSSLDEIPQLFNIIKGDMSFIGPRPLLVSNLPYYTEEEHHRHDVRPGITGLAQINGRNNLTNDEKFALDVQYVRTISFINDVKIVIKTIINVLRRSDINVVPHCDTLRIERAHMLKDKNEKENNDESRHNRS